MEILTYLLPGCARVHRTKMHAYIQCKKRGTQCHMVYDFFPEQNSEIISRTGAAIAIDVLDVFWIALCFFLMQHAAQELVTVRAARA